MAQELLNSVDGVAVALVRRISEWSRGSFCPSDPGMKDKLKNARTHIPDDLYRQLAHLAVDLPDSTVGSLLVEGARLVLQKYRAKVHESTAKG